MPDLELFLKKVCLSVLNHKSDFIYNEKLGIDELCVCVEKVINKYVNDTLLNLSVDFLGIYNLGVPKW